MPYTDHFLKSYPGERTDFVYTTAVTHRGTVIAFAMNAARRIFYTVLALDEGDGNKSPIDVNHWSDSPTELRFSNELGQVGMSIAGQTRMPMVKRGGRQESDPRSVRADDVDPFLSTTARLTAKAPFCVLSDDQHIYIFRQAIDPAHDDMAYKLIDGGATGNRTHPALVKDSAGAAVPLVNGTLLMDRFLLAGTALTPKMEVRYRRSRHKERPHGQKDTLGAKDMDGVPFFEPTLELDFVRGLRDGCFHVMLLPTQVADIRRWQIFAYNDADGTVDTFNIEQARDGLFNTRGTIFSANGSATSTEPAHNETPGIRRDHLKLTNCGAVTGIAAQLYHQQEALGDDGGGAAQPVKQNARVLVALSTAATHANENPYIAALDFAVTRAGSLASMPSSAEAPFALTLPSIARTSGVHEQDSSARTQTAQRIATLETELAALAAKIVRYTRVEGHLETLVSKASQRINNGARFYVHRDYQRPEIALRLSGETYIADLAHRTDDGQSNNWKDEISSVSVDYGIIATLWYNEHRRDSSVEMRQSGNLPQLEDDTQSIEIRESGELSQDMDRALSDLSTDTDLLSASFDAHTWKRDKARDRSIAADELASIRTQLAAVEREQATKRTALRQAQSQLDQLSTVHLGEAKMPMPLLHSDQSGLTVTGGILAFAWSEQPPVLLDSGIGQVALYFRGGQGQFFAAYYDTICRRGRFVGELAGSLDQLALTLRSAELDPGAVTIEIADDEAPEFCRVTITQPAGYQESWHALPRDAGKFVQILNGQQTAPRFMGHGVLLDEQTLWLPPALHNTFLSDEAIRLGEARTKFTASDARTASGDVHYAIYPLPKLAAEIETVGTLSRQSVTHSVLHLESAARYVIPAGSILQIDDVQVTVRQRVPAGATQIQIHAVHETLLAGSAGQAIDILPYDGVTDRQIATLSHAAGPQPDTLFLHLDAAPAQGTDDKAPRLPSLQAGDVLRAGAALFRVEEQIEPGLVRVLRMNRAEDVRSGPVERLPEYPIFRLDYDYERNSVLHKRTPVESTYTLASIGPLRHGSVLTAAMVLPARAGGDGADEGAAATVQNGTLTLATPDAHPPRWVGNAPGQALALTGSGGAKLADTANLDHLDAPSDLSLELWVKSSRVGDEAGLDQQTLVHHHNETSRYAIGLARTVEKGALDSNGHYYVDVPAMTLDFRQGLTLEGWVNGYYGGALFDFGRAGANERIVWGFDQWSSILRLQITDANGHVIINEVTGTPVKQATWTHVAVTLQPTATGSTLSIYQDGQRVHEAQSGFAFSAATSYTMNFLGATRPSQAHVALSCLYGKLDELRVWTYARSAEQVADQRFARVAGNGDGLAACWRYRSRDGVMQDHTANQFDGAIMQNSHHWNGSEYVYGVPANSVSVDSPFYAYAIAAGIGQSVEGTMVDAWTESEAACIQPDQWHHIAATYNQSYALRLDDRNSYLSVDHAAALSLSQDLTLEAFVQLDTLGETQGIMAKGALQVEQEVPYSLSVLEDGRLRFAFENQEGDLQEFTSTGALQAGRFHKIAVTRTRGYNTAEEKKQLSSDEKKQLGLDANRSLELVQGVDVQYWHQITFYIDGVAAGSARYDNDDIGANNQPVTIGRVGRGQQTHGLAGIVSEVRIWSEPVAGNKIGKRIRGTEAGLAAWWRLDENEGSMAADEKGGNHAKLNGSIRWIKSPDATQTGSMWRLYCDGTRVPGRSRETPAMPWGSAGAFALGAGAGDANPSLGDMEEVRIWRTLRTQEQILDNLFTRLKGEAADLIAYYTFDPDHTDRDRIVDAGLRGVDLSAGSTELNISTAPISVDTAEVRSAISLVKTRFHGTLDASPAAVEYGDLQYDFDGNALGVLKRCYVYIRNGAWHLVTGYKVGNLITEWIGQAQFDPQIMGYVEGAPPVPSENLTFGPLNPARGDYANAAEVTVEEADEVTYTFARSENKGMDAAFEGDAGFGMAGGTHLVLAPLGIGVLQNMAQWKLANNLTGKFNASQSWSSEEQTRIGRNRSRDLTVGLSGAWESGARPLNPAVGRRYQPSNMGFALVQSETADVYALRMAHNRRLVAFRFLPNPDIPADVNLIPFPINPRYTKQGTLDGGIGYSARGKVVDPDYPQATTYGAHSYFKPKEAYALKKRIQQEEHRLRSYYESYEAISGSAGAGIAAGVSAAGAALSGSAGLVGVGMGVAALSSGLTMLGQALTEDKNAAEKFAKRNLINTYVWTADGGFYAEETQLTDVKQETVGGSYNFSGGVGGSTQFEIDALGGSLSFGMTGTLGGHYSLTKTKSEEAKRAFSVRVKVDVSGDLQEYDPQRKRIYDAGGNPINVPGKVDAYRFMTFYMASDHTNFDDLFSRVVDPIWLQQSTHPNAAAMRQAQQVDKKPPCWRVFHRVTFVSRILPEFPMDTAPPLPKAMKEVDIDSNWELIQQLEPYVKPHLADRTAFRQAVRHAVQTQLAELSPYLDEIQELAGDYFGVAG